MMGRFEPAEPLARYGICGTPWHGPVKSAQLTLPNGATMPYRQPTGDIHRGECATWLLAVPGIPPVVRSEQEQLDDAAAGMQWRNVATISGDQMQLYGKPLGAGNWIYVDPDGGRWLVQSGLHGANVHTLAAAGKITLRLRRFGVIDGTTAADIEVEIPVGYTSFVSASWAGYPSSGDGSLPIRLGALHPAGAAAAWMVWRSLQASQPFLMTPLAWFEIGLAGVPGSAVPGQVFSATITIIDAEFILEATQAPFSPVYHAYQRIQLTHAAPPIMACPTPDSPAIEMYPVTITEDISGVAADALVGGLSKWFYTSFAEDRVLLEQRVVLGVSYDPAGARSLIELRMRDIQRHEADGNMTDLGSSGSLYYSCNGSSVGTWTPVVTSSVVSYRVLRSIVEHRRFELSISGAGDTLDYWYETGIEHSVAATYGADHTSPASVEILTARSYRTSNMPGFDNVELDAVAGSGYLVAGHWGYLLGGRFSCSVQIFAGATFSSIMGNVTQSGSVPLEAKHEHIGLAAYSPSVWGVYSATSILDASPAPGSARFIGELATTAGRRSVADRVIAQPNVLLIGTAYWPYASLCPATGAIAWETERVCWV